VPSHRPVPSGASAAVVVPPAMRISIVIAVTADGAVTLSCAWVGPAGHRPDAVDQISSGDGEVLSARPLAWLTDVGAAGSVLLDPSLHGTGRARVTRTVSV
jgi:hypothetical protein